MPKSLNRVELIGNLTRDPELRYTPQGTAVCSFSIATNRQWTNDSGEKQEDVEFHRIVAWSKLAEICAQLLKKGRKVYVEGRLQTRDWETNEGDKRRTTEIVISDMILLDSRYSGSDDFNMPDSSSNESEVPNQEEERKKKTKSAKKTSKKDKKKEEEQDEPEDDIPF